MTAELNHPLVREYLHRLELRATDLPPSRRVELVREIRQHLDDALAGEGSQDEAAIRNELDRLGSPDEIVSAELQATGGASSPAVRESRRVGGVEVAAIALLAVGGLIVPLLGVLVGLAIAWMSGLWTRREKTIATAIPVGLVLVAVLAIVLLPTGGQTPAAPEMALLPDTAEYVWTALWMAPVLGGLLAAAYLAIRAQRHTRQGHQSTPSSP